MMKQLNYKTEIEIDTQIEIEMLEKRAKIKIGLFNSCYKNKTSRLYYRKKKQRVIGVLFLCVLCFVFSLMSVIIFNL